MGQPNNTTFCQNPECGHDMKRSRVRFVGADMTVRCNKCKTVHTITIKFPKDKT